MESRDHGDLSPYVWFTVFLFVAVFGFLWFIDLKFLSLVWTGLGAALLVSAGGLRPLSPEEAAYAETADVPAADVPRLSSQMIDSAFQVERIEPERVSLLYWVGLLVVAIGMVLLLGLYVGMIGVMAWLLFVYAASASITGFLGALVYFTVTGTLAVLVFFMIKPLFSELSQSGKPMVLNKGEQPELEFLIRKLSRALRAPMPKRIAVDCEANAHVGYTHGMLGEDLTLVIGLPLVSGLNLTSLAGVLAHELAHFSQGNGMRLSYVISRINAWFARVIYERDRWDAWLERGATEGVFRFGWYLALLLVGISRWILSAVMRLGHVISTFLLRQMEYHADSYEARIIGSSAFQTTNKRFLRLNRAVAESIGIIYGFWQKDRRLADNIPFFVATHAESFDEKEVEKDIAAYVSARTRLFDTHPSYADREKAVVALEAQGIFMMDIPAEELFRDYEELAKRASRHYYRNTAGLSLDNVRMVPSASLVSEYARLMIPYDACERFFGVHPFIQESFRLDESHLDHSLAGPEALREQADAHALRMAEAKEKAASLYQDVLKHDFRRSQLLQGETLESAGVGIPHGFYDIPGMDLPADRLVVENGLWEIGRQLQPYHAVMKDVLIAHLRLAIGGDTTDAPRADRIRQMATAFAQMKDAAGFYGSLRMQIPQLGILIYAIENGASASDNKFREELDRQAAEVEKGMAKLREAVTAIPFPFPGEGFEDVCGYIAKDLENLTEEGKARVGAKASRMLASFSELYYRILGELVLLGEEEKKGGAEFSG